MAKEHFKDWDPSDGSQDRLEKVLDVLAQYAGMDLRITLRQLFYQLVSKNFIANKQREYKNLGELLSRARLAGLVDWGAIEDRIRQPDKHAEWADIPDLVESAVSSFRLPRWSDQECCVELWCEKDALTSVLEPITNALHVTLMVNRGYSSQSAMYEAAQRWARSADDGKKNILLYLGDFDPSGQDMVRDVRDRLAMFGQEVDVRKLALNPDQVARYGLPPNPAKLTDSRAAGFVAKHGGSSYEVDALPPDVLAQLVRGAIEDTMDMKLYAAWRAQEKVLKAKLVAVAKATKW